MNKVRLVHQITFGLMVLLTLLHAGCSSTSRLKDEPAIAVAKDAVRKKWGWTRVEVGSAQLVQGRWVIGLWRLPKTPGGMATVEVTPDGTLIGCYPGL